MTGAEEFVTHLRPADILLFDKLASLNRLVQWGDNRPVGHCGLWTDGGVYEATIKTSAAGRGRSGVFHTPLNELLNLTVADSRGANVALVRTVTAVRYRGIDDERRLRVLQFAQDCTSSTRFAAIDAWLLTPFAVERSYSGGDEPLNDVIAGVIRACKQYARRSLAQRSGATDRMFCSELVYRSYEKAGLRIEILDPLFARYRHAHRRSAALGSPAGQRGWRGEDPANTMALLDDYEDFFEQEVLSPRASAVGHRDADADTGAADGVPDIPQTRGGAAQRSWGARRRAPEFADMITPGDFWSSPSLDPIAVLHRPAGR
jgi:hypothetical protein